MSKVKGSGFLSALIVAVVSFFVIFFFFTDMSDKYFGVSIKGVAEETVETIEKIDGKIITDTVENTVQTVVEKVQDIDLSQIIGTPQGKN